MHSQQQKDYDSSPPATCAELDYLGIHSQPGEMRYTQEANTSTLAIEPTQSSTLLNLFHPPGLGTTAPYPQDGTAFYQPASHVFPGLDVRPRLNSHTTPSTGMAHAHTHTHQHQHQHQHHPHRIAGLPHPAPQISTRDQYSAATPSFRRAAEHPTRSPSFAGAPLRRLPLSPTPSPLTGFTGSTGRMDANQYQNRCSATTIPPLLNVQTAGSLQYVDGTPIKVDITGTVDKGFFLSDGEWTCYRRNYMACACSYSLAPHFPAANIQYIPSGSTQTFQVFGFSMCISAVVADNDQHSIDLVQHTPKRDKGPISKPEKIPLAPKNIQQPAHHAGMYSDSSTAPGSRSMYSENFANSQASGQPATEHTFERIQFKQATQNNGKRRAAQQYYHLMVELWADLGTQISEKHVKVAYRKSEKMIVRGRSPGHYQNEKRRSHSNGPGGSAGTLGSYSGMGGMDDFSPNAIMGGSNNYTTYDPRGPVYGGARHHDIPVETAMTPEEEKAIGSTKGYQYYPGPMYEGHHPRVDLFNHRSEPENAVPHMATDPKVKHEYDIHIMPRAFHPPPMAETRRHNGPFEGKTTSSGYYPTMMTPPGSNMSMP